MAAGLAALVDLVAGELALELELDLLVLRLAQVQAGIVEWASASVLA